MKIELSPEEVKTLTVKPFSKEIWRVSFVTSVEIL